jgi:hypothetical protein
MTQPRRRAVPELRPAYLVHALPGRARIRIPSARGDRAFLARLREQLAGRRGVRIEAASVITGSLLIYHQGAFTDIADFAAEAGLFTLASGEPSLPPARGQLSAALRALDDGLRGASGGASDLRLAVALLFFVLAAVQLSRGNILIPALPLAWNGLVLLGLGSIGNGADAASLGNAGSGDD